MIFTAQSNSRLKYQKPQQHSWTRKCTKATDLPGSLSLNVQTHYKETETFQYTNVYTCHPPGVTKGFIRGEALRLLRTNSSCVKFDENTSNFKIRLKNRGYPENIVERHLPEMNFNERKSLLKHKNDNARSRILPFDTKYHPVFPNLKNILISGEMALSSKPTSFKIDI